MLNIINDTGLRMKSLEIFHEISADPYAYAKKWKAEKGGKVVGYFCSYTPEELITAAGALPFRIFGTKEQITCADSHLQSYCCSLVRGGLEDALTGKLAFLDGTVFPHTCDSIQRLSDIWRLNGRFSFHLDVILPVKVNTASAREYMASIFRKFKEDLGRSLRAKIDDRLQDTIKLYNNIKSSLEEIYLMRDAEPGLISGSDVHAIIKSSMVMDRSDLLGFLRKTVEEMKAARPEKKEYKRIYAPELATSRER
jgi:benzoyl-CoA reductase/2-hydroxyglutaryl-CoA dehydratase subunit BcrC/BadD/HgdB